MYRFIVALGLMAAGAIWPSVALAHVGSSNSSSCVGCHSSVQTGHLAITGLKQINLGTQLDGNARGLLDVFEVVPGGSVTIPIQVLNGASEYGLSINELNHPGVKNSLSDVLGYTADSSWVLNTGSPNPHYIKGNSPLVWGGSALTYNFTLGVSAATPLDYYDVQVFVAGLTSSGTKWSQQERIYISVVQAQWSANVDGNWSAAANWTGGVPSGAGAAANFLGASTSPRAVTLDSPRSAGSITFNNLNKYTLAGSTLTLDNGAGTATVKVLAGSHDINSASVAAGNTTVDVVTGQTFRLGGGLTINPGKTLTKLANGAASNGTLAIAGATALGAGSSLVLGSGSTTADSIAGAVSTRIDSNNANQPFGQQYTGSATVSNGATLAASNIRLASLTIGEGATVSIAANDATPAGRAAHVSVLNGLTIQGGAGGNGALDLRNNNLIINYDPAIWSGGVDFNHTSAIEKQIRQYVANWAAIGSGPQIQSSIATNTTFAVFDNVKVQSSEVLDGIPLGSRSPQLGLYQIVVKYSYVGDADLNGKVTPADYGIVDANINRGLTPANDASWDTGDMDYSGVVNPFDYLQIDGNINAGDGVAGGPNLFGVSAVPEPTALSLLGLGALGLLRRRRRV